MKENFYHGNQRGNYKMKVVYFQRRPRPFGNFSLENTFDAIRAGLPKEIQAIKETVSFYSSGLFKRIFISLEVIFKQGDINHVTGDVNFLAIFLPKRKTLLTVLDIGMVANHSNSIKTKILKFFWFQLPIKRAGTITTISESTKKEWLKHINVDEKKLRVVHIPVVGLFKYYPKEFNNKKPVI